MTNKLAKSISHPAADVRSAAGFILPQAKQERSTRPSFLVLWHLLSLDAPTIAVLWTVFTAAITQTRLTPETPVAMALTVWTLYASDRLLDTRHLSSNRASETLSNLEPRHLFHYHYRTSFVIAIMVCTIGLAGLLPVLPPAAIRLYLIEGALMASYFLLIHANPKAIADSRRPRFFSNNSIPKEILVGPFFAAAIFIPTVSRKPELRLELLPLATLFAALCSLNCLYIYAWENPESSLSHWTTTYAIRNLGVLTSLCLAASLLCFVSLGFNAHASLSLRLYPLACGTSTFLLLAIHKHRQHFSSLVLRSAADAALLTPMVVMPFLFRHHP